MSYEHDINLVRNFIAEHGPDRACATAHDAFARILKALRSGSVNALVIDQDTKPVPILMRLPCPACHELHIDEHEFAQKPHHTHACQHCGNCWRPAIVPTCGVRFLPGFKNEAPK